MLNIYHPHGCHWKGTTILWWDACYYYLGFALLVTINWHQVKILIYLKFTWIIYLFLNSCHTSIMQDYINCLWNHFHFH
jgi:hypothetical protein